MSDGCDIYTRAIQMVESTKDELTEAATALHGTASVISSGVWDRFAQGSHEVQRVYGDLHEHSATIEKLKKRVDHLANVSLGLDGAAWRGLELKRKSWALEWELYNVSSHWKTVVDGLAPSASEHEK